MSMLTITSVSVVSFVVSFVVGALAQSSRMCFIGGWRDFFLVRDTFLLKGFFSFLIAASLFFFITNAAGLYVRNYPWFDRPPVRYSHFNDITGFEELDEQIRSKSYCDLISAPDILIGIDTPVPGVRIFNVKIPNEVISFVIAAFVIGFCTTLANGCPVRQHVMAASGNLSAMLFILGFYIAVLTYDKFFVGFFDKLMIYT